MMPMQTIPMCTTRNSAKGFSLLEVFLALGVLSLLVTGAFKVFDDWAKESVNQTVASEIAQHQRSIESYIFSRFTQEIAPFRLDTDPDPPTTFEAIDFNDVIDSNFLPLGYAARTSHRQSLESYFRIVRNPVAVDQYNFAIEVITLTADVDGVDSRLDNRTLMNTARGNRNLLGVVMGAGLVPALNTDTRATSIQNSWSIPLGEITGYTENANANSGYLAAYSRVVAEGDAVNDNFLYRTRIQDRPELNRMATDLRMQQNAIRGVNTVTVDYMDVEGAAYIRGDNTGVAGDITPALTIDSALRVSGADSNIMQDATNTRGGNVLLNAVDDTGTGANATQARMRVGGSIETPLPDVYIGDGSTNIFNYTFAASEIHVFVNNIRRTADFTVTGLGSATGGSVIFGSGSIPAAGDRIELTGPGTIITDNATVNNTLTSNGITSLNTLNNTGVLNFTSRFHTPALNMADGTTFASTRLNTETATVNQAEVRGTTTVGTYNQVPDGLATNQAIVPNNLAVRANARVTTLTVDTMTATEVLRVASATGSYTDPSRGNRPYICQPDSIGRTFCEPNGSAILPGGISETCTLITGGYRCNYNAAGRPNSQCTYTRSAEVVGVPAKHTVICGPIP